MPAIQIPISKEDSYIINTFKTTRHLRAFNKNLRGVSVPIGPFHSPLHEQALFETDASNRSDISHMVNLYSSREPKFDGYVSDIIYDNKEDQYYANVQWNDKEPHPLIMRITAILQGKKCIRVLQFGVE